MCQKLNIKLVHSTTDCVFTGSVGSYTETDLHDETSSYGLTKSLGEPSDCTVIRTSIIGEEVNTTRSLVEWIKSNNCGQVNGYQNHLWNGITCLQYAQILHQMIDQDIFWQGVRHIFSPEVVSKYQLVKLVNSIYKLNIDVIPSEALVSADKSLRTVHETNSLFDIPSLQIQIEEMRKFSPQLYDWIIPRVSYLYWDGNPLSYLQYLTITTFKEHNPNWSIILYQPAKRFMPKTWTTPEQKIMYSGTDYLGQLLSHLIS